MISAVRVMPVWEEEGRLFRNLTCQVALLDDEQAAGRDVVDAEVFGARRIDQLALRIVHPYLVVGLARGGQWYLNALDIGHNPV